jgi:hypothetical protein
MPISQLLTLAAKRREQSDSPVEDGSGDIFTNINVLESPPKYGCQRKNQKVKLYHNQSHEAL